MENMNHCQSCGMPMKDEHYGTEKDGSKSGDYCSYCYKDGGFTSDETMEQMIETCIPFTLESGAFKTADEARACMQGFLPTLKRWAL